MIKIVNSNAIVGFGIAALVIIVMFSVAPIVGSIIDDTANIQGAESATGTLTFTGNSAVDDTVTIGSETYTFTNGTGGAFNVDVGSDSANASYSCSQLVAEINANSTLVTAVNNGDNSTTVTSIISGTTGNSYATTEDLANAAWGSATLSGGVDSDWDSESNSDLQSPAESWIMFVGLIVLAFLAIIISKVIIAFRDMGE